MAVLDSIKTLQQTVNQTTALISADVHALQTTMTDLRTQIVLLQQQVASGGGLTDADLQPIFDAMQAHEAELEGVHAAGQHPTP